jgi:hypothetical protein
LERTSSASSASSPHAQEEEEEEIKEGNRLVADSQSASKQQKIPSEILGQFRRISPSESGSHIDAIRDMGDIFLRDAIRS